MLDVCRLSAKPWAAGADSERQSTDLDMAKDPIGDAVFSGLPMQYVDVMSSLLPHCWVFPEQVKK